jgi:hypothetical protein
LFFNRFTLAIFFVLSVLVGTSVAVNCDGSSRCHVRKAAAGTGTGADWTNACTDFTGNCALARGITYYVATGTYTGPQHITTAVSGSTLITIKGATAADHGMATGWNNSFGVDVTQAKFSWFNTAVFFGFSTFWVDTSFITIDGNTGTDGQPSTYGFASPAIASCASNDWAAFAYGGSNNASNNTIRWFAFDASACSDATQVVRTLLNESTTGNYNNNLTSHVYCNKTQDCVTYHWSNGFTAATGNIVEYMWVPVGGAWDGDTNHHGEQFNMFCQDGTTIRYSTVLSGTSTGLLVANDATTACDSTVGFNNGKIYGNVFGGNCCANNGVITSTGASGIKNTVVYNNTIVNVTTGPWFGPLGFNTSNTVKNNIVWNSPCSYGAPLQRHIHIIHFFPALIRRPPRQAGKWGLTRGSDGTWERGAFEFQSGGLSRSVSASVTFAVAAARVLAAVRNPSASVGFTALSQGVRGRFVGVGQPLSLSVAGVSFTNLTPGTVKICRKPN